MTKPKILAFAGSTRRGSFSKQILDVAVQSAEAQGASVTAIDLSDFELPIYNEDLEAANGLPQNAAALQTLLNEHDGLLIVTPEYNGFFPALLKNTLDWISRATETQGPLASFQGKPTGLFSVSPGGLGGIRALGQLRTQMSDLGAVVSTIFSVGGAHEAVGENGQLKDENRQAQLDGAVSATLKLAGA